MAIEGFDYKEQYIGTSDTNQYSFSFFIFDPLHLHIYIQDQFGNIISDTSGADTSLVSALTFDTSNGGGTLTLIDNLPNQYTLTMLLANDDPDQPTDFPNKQSFTFQVIEGALDYLASWGQRAAYLAQRSMRLHDLDDVDSFDMRMPINANLFASCFLQINSDGTGFAFGPTYAELIDPIAAAAAAAGASEAAAAASAVGAAAALSDAQNSAAAAASSQIAASSSATDAAASAALAATFASGIVHSGPFTSIAANASAALAGETTDHTKFTMIEYTARIQRGTTVFAKQLFTIFYRNSAWEIAIGQDQYADAGSDHGVTFTVNATTAQITASVANDGGSNAQIDLNKIQWPA